MGTFLTVHCPSRIRLRKYSWLYFVFITNAWYNDIEVEELMHTGIILATRYTGISTKAESCVTAPNALLLKLRYTHTRTKFCIICHLPFLY